MNWFRYNNFKWSSIALLSLILNFIIIAFFNNSQMQIDSVSVGRPDQVEESREKSFDRELKQNMTSLLDQLHNQSNVSQLRYPYIKNAYWIVARNGYLIYETGTLSNLGLTQNWQKHFMLGAHIGSRNPKVFETKSLTLVQQPISYEEFLKQQFKLRSLQIGFHNVAYCYAQKNRYSILVLFNSNPREWAIPKIKKVSINYPTVSSDLNIILLCLIVILILILLHKTVVGFWIKRKFARQYALFYFSLLLLLAAFLVIQISSIIKVKEFNVTQNLMMQFKQNLGNVESRYSKYRENLEALLVSRLKGEVKNNRLFNELGVEVCNVTEEELFKKDFKDDTDLAQLMCRLYGRQVYTQNHKSNQLVKWSFGDTKKEIIWINASELSKQINVALLSTKAIHNSYFKTIKNTLPQGWSIAKTSQHYKSDELYFNVHLSSNIFDFDVVYSISKKIAFSEIRQFELNIYIIIFVVFLLAIPSWYFMSLSMTEPIDKILKGLSNVKQRKWDTLEITSKNEFGKVMRDFNNMVQTLREKSKLSSFVAEQILELLSNEKGELINQIEDNAAVVFSDIRSFTSISESHDSEEVVDMLNKYFEIWQSAVQKRGGVIERFIGDAIVIIFFERFSKQYAQDAVQCSMDVMSQMSSFNEQRFQSKQFTVKNGVGISQGKVRFSVIGNDVKKHLFASGQAVIESERLESLSKKGKKSMIIVDENVFKTTRYEFDYQVIENNLFSSNIYELELDQSII